MFNVDRARAFLLVSARVPQEGGGGIPTTFHGLKTSSALRLRQISFHQPKTIRFICCEIED